MQHFQRLVSTADWLFRTLRRYSRVVSLLCMTEDKHPAVKIQISDANFKLLLSVSKITFYRFKNIGKLSMHLTLSNLLWPTSLFKYPAQLAEINVLPLDWNESTICVVHVVTRNVFIDVTIYSIHNAFSSTTAEFVITNPTLVFAFRRFASACDIGI